MSEYVYAQVQNGKVIAISTGPSQMVRLEAANNKLLGTSYTGASQDYVDLSNFTGYKATVSANKSEIAADGVETVTISVAIKTWDDVATSDFNGAIRININGARKDLAVTNGSASYIYKTTSIGTKNIVTQDADGFAYISHGSVTINAYGELEDL